MNHIKMNHVELIEKIRDSYLDEFEKDTTWSVDVEAFRTGMIFAFNYLIEVLKNGGMPYM